MTNSLLSLFNGTKFYINIKTLSLFDAVLILCYGTDSSAYLLLFTLRSGIITTTSCTLHPGYYSR